MSDNPEPITIGQFIDVLVAATLHIKLSDYKHRQSVKVYANNLKRRRLLSSLKKRYKQEIYRN